jgi:release factor glutamine methyltransferase
METSPAQIWTVRRLVEWTSAFLERKGVDSPRLAAELLLAHILQLPRIQLYLTHDRQLSPIELSAFRDLVRRAGEHEPVQYLTGTAHFFGLELLVTPDVLIPRADTETLVEAVLHHLKLATDTGIEQALRIADLCTGSGAIALALAKYLPNARVIATEISEAAARMARENARRLGLTDVMDIRTGDLFAPLEGEAPFDIITCNPPYVPTSELAKLDRNVRDHEPRQALDGGPDGLAFHRRLLAEAPRHLLPGGRLFMEMQFDQGDALRELAEQSDDWREVQILRDFAGHQRVLFSRLAEGP